MEVLSTNLLQLEDKRKIKMKPESLNSNLVPSNANKQTRSASSEEKMKLTWSKMNGKPNTPYSNVSQIPSTDEWTSSTDYSPSSRSFTISSASGSIDNENSSEQLAIRNVESKVIKTDLSNGEAVVNVNTGDRANRSTISLENNGDIKSPNQTGINKSNSLMADCSDISDYLENALFVSNGMTSDHGKTMRNGNHEQSSSPRVVSFQSPLNLSYGSERLLDNTDAEPSVTGFKPDIVTLDFVKSAAQTFKSSSASNNDDADSYSSLTSSFMSSVDSHDGSSIDSDVVENLYSKIAAATAKHKLKLMNSESGKVDPQQAERFDDKHLIEVASSAKCDDCGGTAFQPDQNTIKNDSRAGTCSCETQDSASAVEEVDLSNSNLKAVPDEIYQHAPTLTSLSLESNAITNLPKELFDCRNLTELYVADNDIALLPPNLAGLTKLRHLDISKNVIEDIPECMPCLKNLVVLDASVNPIEKLSESFTQLMNLQELYMNDCFFDYLPASFGRMSELRVLELRDNQLQILPKSIRRLLNLSRLDLGGNVLQDWPDVISKLTGLRELWLDCNELNKVSNEIGDLTKLVYLDLSRNFLPSIPHQISSLLELTDLLLSENNLTFLPDNIGFLRSLTVLNLENNQLEKLPDGFGKLESLEEVDLSHNKLRTLPSSLGNLKKLQMLLLDDNKLQSIPEELGCCTMMSVLQLSRNQIECLPDSFGNLKNLRVLNICQNRIPFLPITLRKLSRLEALWISPNQSKPSVPVHVQVDPKTGCQVLTNVLFPQEENGLSRVSKVLGSINSRDNQDYAIDAADDDDLDDYSAKERGTTQVVFDLDATTYSDVWESMQAERHANKTDQEIESDLKERSLAEHDENVSVSRSDFPSADFAKKSPVQRPAAISDYAIVIPKQHQDTGLSVSFDKSPLAVAVNPPEGSIWQAENKIASRKPEVEISVEETKHNSSEEDPRDERSSSAFTAVQISEFREKNVSKKPTDRSSLELTKDPDCESFTLGDKPTNLKDKEINKPSLENLKPKVPAKPANLRPKEYRAPTDSSLSTTFDRSSSFAFNHTGNDDAAKAAVSKALVGRTQSVEDDLHQKDKEQIKCVRKKSASKEKENCSAENKAVTTENVERNTKLDLSKFQFIDNDEESDLHPVNDSATANDGPIRAPYLVEDKPSSVTSGESITATDDSGVGFIDAENHEDNEMDVVVTSKGSAPKIQWKSTSVTLPQPFKSNGFGRQRKSAATSETAAAVITCNQSQADSNSSTISKADSNSSSSPTNLNHCRNQTATSPPKPPVPPPPVAKKNRVSLNIKKFEKQSENASVSAKNNSVFQHNAPMPQPEQTFHVAKTSDLKSKPIAVATILPYEASEPSKPDASVKDENIDPCSPSDKNVSEVLKSFDLYTKGDVVEKPVTVQSDDPLRDQVFNENFKESPQSGNASPLVKSVHVRKSKFDEALAATKHKNFREKLEKAMQQQHNHSSFANSVKRLSRGSTSSIASIPRITSPVPQHHDFSFDSMTADHTTNSSLQQTSNTSILHLKLKEKLHPASISTNSSSSKPDMTLNVNKISRKESTQHRSQSVAPKTQQRNEQNPPKLSLEEQLGQLCLDGSSQSPTGKQGFVNYLPDEYCQSTSTRNAKKPTSKEKVDSFAKSSAENYRRPSKPEDWKHQLLDYLERKKSTSVFPSEKSASFGHLPRRDASRPVQHAPDYQPRSSEEYERFFAHSEEINRVNHAPHSKSSQSSKIGGGPKTTKSTSSIPHFGAPPHSKQPPGRRVAGKYQRTRTPGPEINSSEPKVDLAVRPKSAMDRPIRTYDPFDPLSEMSRTLAFPQKLEYMKKNFPRSSSSAPTSAPPSYQDHISRHVASSGESQEDHQNYVNLDYFHNRLRSSMRDKHHENLPHQQVSRTHVPNSKSKRDASPKQPPIRGSEQVYLPKSQHTKAAVEASHWAASADHARGSERTFQQLHASQQPRAYQPFQPDKQHYANPAFSFNPSRVPYSNQHSQYISKALPNSHAGRHGLNQARTPKFVDRRAFDEPVVYDSHAIYEDPYRVHSRRQDSRNFHQPINNPDFASNYSETPYIVQPAMQQEFVVNDESVSSAFRPYQQQQLTRPRQNQSYNSPNMYYPTQLEDGKPAYSQPAYYDQHHYRPSMDLLDGYQHQQLQFNHPNGERIYSQRPAFHHDDVKPYMDPYKARHHIDHTVPVHDSMEMAVEVFTVTVKKNPNFGFHIMGGVDSGGNPFRPDDDGVYITYVASGGAADGLLQPGDKILMVNGSEFIGINHKRAVDLLRNAGLAAKLVVERLVGRPV